MSKIKKRETYLQDLQARKAELAQERGVKFVKGSTLKKDPEFRRLQKNLYNYDQRAKRRAVREKTREALEKFAAAPSAQKAQRAAQKTLPDSVVQTLAFQEVYHLVLSYGGKVERAIEDAISEGERLNFKVKVRVDVPGERTRVYQNRLNTTIAFQALYNRLIQIQDANNTYPTISAFTQDQGGERIITLKVGNI